MIYLHRRRRKSIFRVICLFLFAFAFFDLFRASRIATRSGDRLPRTTSPGRILITAIHWNNEKILRSHWSDAVVALVQALGTTNVYVSIYESGSWDGTKDALRQLDGRLGKLGVARSILLDETTHLDEISKTPGPDGWVNTPRGKTELRRIPYLSRLRNWTLKPIEELDATQGRFDRVLFLNDVVFTVDDVLDLLDTEGGDYAAACSLDFSKPPSFYDTFALRDDEGHEPLMQTWPYFRSRQSRSAMMANIPVPVSSCWNGIVAMDTAPFYNTSSRLRFRGVPDSLAPRSVEGSECCLIHADNPLSTSKGVWLNPSVRVGYSSRAYDVVHGWPLPSDGNVPGSMQRSDRPWLTTREVLVGLWMNRLRRWSTTDWFKLWVVNRRLAAWQAEDPRNTEPGAFCLVNEMQVLVHNGWAHV